MNVRCNPRWASCTVASLVLAVGCGGRAVTTDTEPRESDTTRNDGPTEQAGDTGGTGGTGDGLDPTLELGDCGEGWQPGEAPCPWRASNDLCYASKEEACSCICPREGNTTCSSGLPGGEDSRTPVSCR